jgi:mono/diheme cytochrome c family protein/predicted small secreted protein
VRHLRIFAVVVCSLGVAACGESGSGDGDDIDHPYEPIQAEPQRAGDPAKGYDYLINGGYVTCGLPKSIAPAGNAADRMSGRTGDNTNLPYFWSAATSREGVRVVSANCLLCHASKINGQLVVGLGAHDRDFTQDQVGYIELAGGLISNPTERAEWERFRDRMVAIREYQQTATIGVNPADSFTAVLMAHRNPQTLEWSNEPLLELPPEIVVPVDVPPWWRMKKKNAMFYTASGRGDHARIMMAASLLCTEDVAEATEIDEAFIDVRAWIEQAIEAPKYPFAIDMNRATRGQAVFEETCASCHGTYGDKGHYPNQLVPLVDVGTDPTLVTGETEFAARYIDWFARSFWGETSRMEPTNGYIAPPLDGIWATAPYLHNGSVPTVAALLQPSQRPDFWTRNFGSTTDYDEAQLGWKYTKLDHGQAEEESINGKSKIYDTRLLGYGNGGHRFGEDLSDDDRAALIEYLKTL